MAVILAATVAMGGSLGQANAQEPVSNGNAGEPLPYDEKVAQGIDGMLMCPVCPAETIDQAQVPIAKQMRRLVREKLAQGESREQILAYFAGVYGEEIRAAPSKSGINLVAWTVPVIGVLAALAAGLFVLRAMSNGSAGHLRNSLETATGPDERDDLGEYLRLVDRELGIEEPVAPGDQASDRTGSPDGQGGPNG